MPSPSDRATGAQFDVIDKAVAARARELLSRQSLTLQDVQEWQTDYNQLASFGRLNSSVEYVARQWRDEEPRYANVVQYMMQKVTQPVKYTPRLYNENLSLSGNCCGCSSEKDGTQLTDKGGGGNTIIAPRGSTPFSGTSFPAPSVGDAIKNFFGLPDVGHYGTPQISAPQSLGNDPIPTSNLLQYILFAGLLAVVLYAVWKVSKKK